VSALNDTRWDAFRHSSEQRDYLASLEAWCVANGADIRAELAAELAKQQHSNAEMAEAVEHSRLAAVRMAQELRDARKAA